MGNITGNMRETVGPALLTMVLVAVGLVGFVVWSYFRSDRSDGPGNALQAPAPDATEGPAAVSTSTRVAPALPGVRGREQSVQTSGRTPATRPVADAVTSRMSDADSPPAASEGTILAEMPERIQESADRSDANARETSQQKTKVILRLEEIVETFGIKGPAPARMPKAVRESLKEAALVAEEASALEPNNPDVVLLSRDIKAWREAAQSPASTLLAMVPDDADMVGLVNLEKMREWPGLSAFISDWAESPQIVGLTRDISSFFKNLGVRPLGAARCACMLGFFDQADAATRSIAEGHSFSLACGFATHLRWEEIARAITDVSPSVARSSDDPRTMAVAGVLLCESEPGYLLLGPESLVNPATRAFRQRFRARSVPDIWEVADINQRREDFWIVIRRVPVSRLTGSDANRRNCNAVLSGQMGPEEVVLSAALTVEDVKDAGQVRQLVAEAFDRMCAEFQAGAEPEDVRLASLGIVFAEGDTVYCRLTMTHGVFEQVVRSLRHRAMPEKANPTHNP